MSPLTLVLIYVTGAALTGGVVAALIERDRYTDRVEARMFGGVAALIWPAVLAFGIFILLAMLGYRLVRGYVDKAAGIYDDIGRTRQ